MTKLRPRAEPTMQIENVGLIVTTWRFAPGAETGRHRHRCDYVVVPQTDGPLLRESADGEATAELRAGAAYFRNAGVEHHVINPNRHEFVFVEIELK